jgi:hypothetical protein
MFELFLDARRVGEILGAGTKNLQFFYRGFEVYRYGA